MIGKRIVCSHRPGICGNVVNLDVKIGANSAACNAVDFAVEANRGVEVGGDSVRRQARVISIADRVVAPKCGCGVEVLINASKQVDISTVACAAEPTSRRWKRGNRRPGIRRRPVLIRVCDSDVVGDPPEAVNVAPL